MVQEVDYILWKVVFLEAIQEVDYMVWKVAFLEAVFCLFYLRLCKDACNAWYIFPAGKWLQAALCSFMQGQFNLALFFPKVALPFCTLVF